MGWCTRFESAYRDKMACQRARQARQRRTMMPLLYSEERERQYRRTADAQRRQVQYLCDQVQVAVAEHKSQSVIDKLLNELSQASGKARIAS